MFAGKRQGKDPSGGQRESKIPGSALPVAGGCRNAGQTLRKLLDLGLSAKHKNPESRESCLGADLGGLAAMLDSRGATAALESSLMVQNGGKGSAKLGPRQPGRAANLLVVYCANVAAVQWGPLDDSPDDLSSLGPLLCSIQVSIPSCEGYNENCK